MAGRGSPPSGSRSRLRDQRLLEAGMVIVHADGELRGPELPETFDWPAATITWWSTWRKSPQAKTFTDTDWSFLLDTAVLHAEFWMGDRTLASELRLRAAKFGATPEDRARLKIEVGEPPVVVPKGRPARARRERLLKAVGDEVGEA